jgi:rubrerythrin
MRTFVADVREMDHLVASGSKAPSTAGERGQSAGRALALGAAVITVGGAAVALGASPAYADDGDIAAYAASVENAFVAAYGIGAAKLSGVVLKVAKTFASHHQDHANAFNAAAGSKAIGNKANPKLVAQLGPQFTNAANQNAVLELAFGGENAAAATYQYALENLTGTAALQLTASIMPVESQHAVVLGTVLGKDVTRNLIPVNFQSKDGFLDPAKYPVGA